MYLCACHMELYACIHLREMNWVRLILTGKQAKQYSILFCKEECHWKKMTHHNNHNRTKDRWCLLLPICFWQVGCVQRLLFVFIINSQFENSTILIIRSKCWWSFLSNHMNMVSMSKHVNRLVWELTRRLQVHPTNAVPCLMWKQPSIP